MSSLMFLFNFGETVPSLPGAFVWANVIVCQSSNERVDVWAR